MILSGDHQHTGQLPVSLRGRCEAFENSSTGSKIALWNAHIPRSGVIISFLITTRAAFRAQLFRPKLRKMELLLHKKNIKIRNRDVKQFLHGFSIVHEQFQTEFGNSLNFADFPN